MKARFTDEQIIAMIKEQKAGEKTADVCRQHEINETLFGTLHDARETLEVWQEDYNWRRPHSALDNMTPMEFMQTKVMDKWLNEVTDLNSGTPRKLD